MRLKGRVALITGAARGQGEAEARLFAAEGAQVVLCDVLDETGCKVADQIGDAASYRHLDVTSEDDWRRVVTETIGQHGKIDVLVNNAGIVRFSRLTETTLDDYQRVISVNQVGVFLGLREVGREMINRGNGSIVNISSVDGLVGMAGGSGYVSSKFAVRGLTKTAAIEFGPYGVRVNSIHPGGVDTPMVKADDINPGALDIFRRVPLRRIGQPEEIAKLALFLASDDSSYSTGSEFIADGGLLAGLPGGEGE